MALIACKECKGQLSSRAKACPHCGAPAPALAGLGDANTWVAGVILAIAFFWLLSKCATG